jgi:hypothetical protein
MIIALSISVCLVILGVILGIISLVNEAKNVLVFRYIFTLSIFSIIAGLFGVFCISVGELIQYFFFW